MADNTPIEWCDATWNPIIGCSVISPGCTNCYAMRLAGGRLRNHPSRAGLTQDGKAGPVWNGHVRFYEPAIDQPLRWLRPRRIFVCAHGDLFHESVPDEWIDLVSALMALTPQHTYLVLTKRANRMREYVSNIATPKRVWTAACEITDTLCALAAHGATWGGETPWPLKNVWRGVSVEDQARADERIPELLATPAGKRFISAEPLLGPIDLHSALWLDWVIVGGESGRGARPMHPNWARSLRDQCGRSGVPFFFKQWGEFYPDDDAIDDHTAMRRVGKKAAGRLLDGCEHREFPA